ncbi:hypothetical protein ACSVC9_07390 [Clostridium sp. LBM24168]
MMYIKETTNTELFEIMYDIAVSTLKIYNAKSFYDKNVYEWLIKVFGHKKTEWFLYNCYRVD